MSTAIVRPAEDVASYLRGKGLSTRPSGREITVPCFFDCGESANSQKRKLYVNAESGVWQCLSGDTPVLTWNGTIPIRDLAGTSPRLLTSAGWVDAPVYSFGRQKLWRIELTRNKVTRIIRATAGHRWFVEAGGSNRREVVTADLRAGRRLSTAKLPHSGTIAPSPWGIAAGFVFGDGTMMGAPRNGSRALFHGAKDAPLTRYYPFVEPRVLAKDCAVEVRYVDGLPRSFKSLPSLDESSSFLYGWLAGYFAADGSVSRDGNVLLASATRENLTFVQQLCNRIGIKTFEIYSQSRIGLPGREPSDLYQLQLTSSSLTAQFFLLPHHRERWESHERAWERLRWTVRSVVETDEVEEVFCAVVPGTHDFALDGYILTGNCWVCSRSGSWKKILEHFGDSIEGTAFERPSRRLQINHEYVTACQDALMNNKRALQYLFARGLTLETIEDFRLGYHPRGVQFVESLPSSLEKGGWTREELRDSGLLNQQGRDFHEGRIVIPYLSSGQVLQVRGRALDDTDRIRYATPAGDQVRLFNSDDLRGADRVLLCEGEVDALIVRQTLRAAPDPTARNIGVVAIPGVNSLPGGKEEFADFFEDVRRVFVGLDNDTPGKQASARIGELLKTKSRVVELQNVKDWGELLAAGDRGWRDVMTLLTEADMMGKRVFSVRESALSLIKMQESRPGIKSGWRTLDALVEPGFMPGQITSPVAKTGSGKSVFLASLAWNRRDTPTLFITLELTKEETVRRLHRIARFHDAAYTDIDVAAQFPLLGIADQNRLSADDFGILVEEFAEEKGERPQIVMVDYLGYYARGQRGKDNYERVTSAIMQLKESAKEHQVHIFCPSQVNRGVKDGELVSMDALRDSGAVEETSDFVFGLSQPHRAIQGAKAGSVTSELKVNLAKSRHGNTGRVLTLHFAPLSLAIVDDTEAANKVRVQQEVEAYNRGVKYEEWLARKRQEAWKQRQGNLGGVA